MSRYFFDVDDDGVVQDDQGVELINLHLARNYAVRVAQDCASRHLSEGRNRSVAVSVRDPAGRRILKISLTCVIEDGASAHPLPR
ncbi:DUF6894 family protein [Methylobacterium soli]|uniref:DUF6894 domain-containing protein n=1 Tax=Methylobacterium soli TaxID=553447 RepID=A0A6L3SRD9_9HYPH|nr:hypothetical protein [Methylobacterium soli]KAB1073317.1 hypothetical protein F6X53_27155 [Methylobacterium soli]